MSKFGASGSILINTQLSSLSSALFTLNFIINISISMHKHQLQLHVYSYENKDQSYSLKHYIVFAYLLLQMHLLLNLLLFVL